MKNTKQKSCRLCRQDFCLVGEGGFEPPKALPADLQSVPFGHSGIPPYSFRSWWSWWTDSNPRPADYKSAALPTELHQHFHRPDDNSKSSCVCQQKLFASASFFFMILFFPVNELKLHCPVSCVKICIEFSGNTGEIHENCHSP